MRAPGWAPAVVLVVGAVLATAGVKAQRALPLRAPLAEEVPRTLEGMPSQDLQLSEGETKAVAVTSYLVRVYQPGQGARDPGITLYVGYYDRQTQGRTIHSPKNCLPGSGWEPLESRAETVETAAGAVTVNRYLLQHGQEQALVLYWYQGRGRVAWNEYGVKWDLLRDAALKRRSDEALVRIVIPVTSTEADAAALAARMARAIIPGVSAALPS